VTAHGRHQADPRPIGAGHLARPAGSGSVYPSWGPPDRRLRQSNGLLY